MRVNSIIKNSNDETLQGDKSPIGSKFKQEKYSSLT